MQLHVPEWARVGVFGQLEALMRLTLAAALGGLVGLEREASGKPAGFRTNMLICLGAALIMELSIGVAALASNGNTTGFRADPARLAAQIVTGIGFIGAGTILHFRGNVSGLTTAATLWVVAAIGMAVGSQAYLEAVATTALVILALHMLGRVEDHLIQRKPLERSIDLTLQPDADVIEHMESVLLGLGFEVDTMKVEKTVAAYQVTFQARGNAKAWRGVVKGLLADPVVRKVELI